MEGVDRPTITHNRELTTPENTVTYHNALCCHPKILHKHCFQFLIGVKMAPRETEDNAYANFWGDKQRALWYAMVFSGVVNISQRFCSLVGNDGGLVVYFSQ